MTYKEIYQTFVNKEAMLWQIVPYNLTGLPSNSIFFKGRCGIGGSTLEMLQRRHSIITVPTTSPINGKCDDFRKMIDERNWQDEFNDMFGVMGEEGITRQARIKRIENELTKTDKFIKIMTTTDSFDCIIEAARNLGKLDWLYANFFLLLDECHSFVTEAFRKNITVPFRYFWQFENKCLISATPFEFSDPAFAELDKHEIIINERLGTIELVEVNDINGIVHFLLTHPDKFPANVHIFYNSIAQLSERVKNAILEVGEIQCNIFCSKSDDNIKKLGELSHLFNEEPKPDNYKKFNFYTSKYTEAWDLHDINATIILITDVHALHTKVGITNKGVQAIGRIRSQPHRIIHFTNHSDKDKKQSIEYFKAKHNLYAYDSLSIFKAHAKKAKATRILPYDKLKDAAEKYGEISEDGYNVELEYLKIDQWVNHDSCSEEYNNIKYIKEAWEASNYNVSLKVCRPESVPNIKKMLVENQLRLAFEMVHKLEENRENMLFLDDYSSSQSDVLNVNKNFELIFKAYHVLGPNRVLDIGFNAKSIKDELKVANEIQIKGNVLELIKKELDGKLPLVMNNKEAKKFIQGIYNDLGYKSTAKGTTLDEYGTVTRTKVGLTIHSLIN